jgi:sulfur-oxidizing protein SoxY
MPDPKTISRRQAVATLGLGVAGMALSPGDAAATPEATRKLLGSLVKAEPKAGRVRIAAPDIAENGNTVPVTISVDSPMTDADHVRAIHVLADRNPNPGVASVTLSPQSGRAEVYFRMRLSESQTIIAVAEMSDGSAWTAARPVIVTIGGCGT